MQLLLYTIRMSQLGPDPGLLTASHGHVYIHIILQVSVLFTVEQLVIRRANLLCNLVNTFLIYSAYCCLVYRPIWVRYLPVVLGDKKQTFDDSANEACF